MVMLATLQSHFSGLTVLLIGIAVGGGWICAILAPNVFYDKLDGSRANTQVKNLIRSGSTPIAGLLLAAACFAFLAGMLISGILALVSSLGFFLNRWTLAGFKRGDTPKGAKRRMSSQRIVAVSLSLLFLLTAAIAGVLAVFGV